MYQDADGQYIVDGDVPIDGDEALHARYLQEYPRAQQRGGGASPSLVVGTTDEGDNVWSLEQARNLTYCVSKRGFKEDYDKIVAATANGAQQWNDATEGIKFVHVKSEDNNCNTSNENVIFAVQATRDKVYIARAFLPNAPKERRNILVNRDQIFDVFALPEDVMAHELGHTLGFRHEHVRPESGGECPEPGTKYRPVTPYDSQSIMHYPHCGGTGEETTMTEMDREGARELYPADGVRKNNSDAQLQEHHHAEDGHNH